MKTTLFFLVATLFVVAVVQATREEEDKELLVANAFNLYYSCGKGPTKEELNKKSMPELIDLVVEGLQRRVDRPASSKKFPDQDEWGRTAIQYFEDMRKRYV